MIKSYRDFLLEDIGSELTQKFDEYTNKVKSLTGIDLNPPKDAEKDSDDWEEDSDDPVKFKTNFTGSKKEMIDLIIKYLNKHQITNPFVQKAILSVIERESGFKSFKESSYKGTSPARIREKFGSRVSGMSDEEINNLKQDDNAFWEKVYGGEWGRQNLGNTEKGDGAKYLGRGFNGFTGRANYKKYGELLRKSGVNFDIVANPDLLNSNKEVAAEVAALFFKEGLSNSIIKSKHGNSDPNDFSDFKKALKAVANVNIGPGNDINGTHKKYYDDALAVSSQFDTYTKSA